MYNLTRFDRPSRQGAIFYKQIAVDNSAAQNPSIQITGVKNPVGPAGEDDVTAVTKTSYVAQNPEQFGYDADGNLISDARYTYTWDAENRLIAVQTLSTVATAFPTLNQRLEFSHDASGRRFSKKVSSWSGSAWTPASSTLFAYDGWNLLAELNALTGNASVCTYVWGSDLSANLQGAGGVGGLLFSNIQTQGPVATAFDGNGNVVGLVAMATGTKSAIYDYSANGETIQTDGVAAAANHFRFSTRYQDDEVGLCYYGLRYYSPGTGRWLSRDPFEENGGVNLYVHVTNDSVNLIDPLGLTYKSNAQLLWDFLSGNGDTNRNYGPNDMQTKEMMTSPGVNKLRGKFYKEGCKNQTNFAYGTGEAAWDTLFNPSTMDWSGTGMQVGGFAGASAIDNGDGTITFTIPNVAGRKSFVYHIAPDKKDSTGSMRSINQTFKWAEPLDKSKCECKR